jgi:hypothetical protein
MTCEKCGNTGHSGKSCPFTQEDEKSIGNDTPDDTDCRPQQDWNSKPDLPFGQQQGNIFNNSFQPSLKNFMNGQKQINDNISEKFLPGTVTVGGQNPPTCHPGSLMTLANCGIEMTSLASSPCP